MMILFGDALQFPVVTTTGSSVMFSVLPAPVCRLLPPAISAQFHVTFHSAAAMSSLKPPALLLLPHYWVFPPDPIARGDSVSRDVTVGVFDVNDSIDASAIRYSACTPVNRLDTLAVGLVSLCVCVCMCVSCVCTCASIMDVSDICTCIYYSQRLGKPVCDRNMIPLEPEADVSTFFTVANYNTNWLITLHAVARTKVCAAARAQPACSMCALSPCPSLPSLYLLVCLLRICVRLRLCVCVPLLVSVCICLCVSCYPGNGVHPTRRMQWLHDWRLSVSAVTVTKL